MLEKGKFFKEFRIKSTLWSEKVPLKAKIFNKKL
jgi:hypothetical protein